MSEIVYVTKRTEKKGFTLVELLVALTVSSIILAAVATLSFALGSAYDDSDEVWKNQSRIRQATLRISELIRNCKLICDSKGGGIAVWRNDDNGDNRINYGELVYVDSGPSGESLNIVTFDPPLELVDFAISMADISSGDAMAYGFQNGFATNIFVIRNCYDIWFATDVAAPFTKNVNLSFRLIENGISRNYQINATLRAHGANLINKFGGIVFDDDD